MNAGTPPPKAPTISTRAPTRWITTVRGPVIIGGIVVFAFALAAGVMCTAQKAQETQKRKSLPPSPAVQGPLPIFEGVPKDYGEVFAQQAAQAKQGVAPGPPDPPAATGGALPKEDPPQAQYAGSLPKEPAPTPGRTDRGNGRATDRLSASTEPKQPPKRAVGSTEGWKMGGNKGAVLSSPYAEDQEDEQRALESPAQALLKPATWVQPPDRHKTLYQIQPIPFRTDAKLSSDLPNSKITLTVTRNVYDRWHTRVLIPQNTKMIAVTGSAQPRPGQRKIPVTIPRMYYGDGTILDLGTAQATDRSGQAGLGSHVDNHIPEILLFAGVSALLNIGARQAAGSSNTFQPSIPQQYAAEVGQSVNQSGQKIVEQYANRPPTITEDAGAEGYAMLNEDLDLSKYPLWLKHVERLK